jgi:hypothetical protein
MYTKGDSLFPASAGFEVLPLRTVLQLLVADVLPFSSRVLSLERSQESWCAA